MIDLKHLREDPERFRLGARRKGIAADVDGALALDARRRELLTEMEALRAEQNRLSKEAGLRIGALMGEAKKADPARKGAIEAELNDLRSKPAALKDRIQSLEKLVAEIDPRLDAMLLEIPQPPDADVPVGDGPEQNVEIRRWSPSGFDPSVSFEKQRGFRPRSHIELAKMHGLVDFERGVRIAGARSYLLLGDGMLLHQAALRFAVDRMTQRHGFTAVSVPCVVREECMVGTGFFPAGREQAYHIEESKRGSGHDLFLAGTGEVGLMGMHQDEILDEATLPRKYVTVSTCFRREAGAAGKDTAGLYRVHQFDKVEQVVICRPDEAESRAWHLRMIGFVEEILRDLGLPHRLLQCCTGDLGPKNADMIDIESWMPGRGDAGADGAPKGAWSETHSASRLYDYQCRRLNMRSRGETTGGRPAPCHSLNNTVIASPRVLIPILEMHQNADGSITIPAPLRPYMNGRERIG